MDTRDTLAEQLSLANDVTVSFESGIAVVTPKTKNDFRSLASFAMKERERLGSLIRWSGAAVLRGFDVATADEYTELTGACLGYKAVTNRVLSALFSRAKRKTRGLGTYDLPPAKIQMQGPHTEAGWRSRRPRLITMWCEEAPLEAGETALFDMAAAYDSLDDDLKAYFDNFGSEYPVFGEKFVVDSVLIHPETKRRCLLLWYYESPLAQYAVAAYRETEHYRQNSIKETIPYTAINDATLAHTFCDGKKRVTLSEEQSIRLMRHVYKAATYFKWQKNDVLIVDNIATGHGRMPCVPPRKIVVGYWNEVDTRPYGANPRVRTDDSPPLARTGASPSYVVRVLANGLRGRLQF